MTRWITLAAWAGIAATVCLSAFVPQTGVAHTVVFPHMPTVIAAPLPPRLPPAPTDIGLPPSH